MSLVEATEIKPSGKYSFYGASSPKEFLDAISTHIKVSLPNIQESVYAPLVHSLLVNQDWEKFCLNRKGVLQHRSLFSTFMCFHRQIDPHCFISLSVVDRGRPIVSGNCLQFSEPFSGHCGEMTLQLNTTDTKDQLYGELTVRGNTESVISEVINFLNNNIKSGSISELKEIFDPKNYHTCNPCSIPMPG